MSNQCMQPGCSLGDGDPMNDCQNGNGFTWQVCFVLTVQDYPQCLNEPDLHVGFETFGDSETGANPDPGCWNDGEWILDLTVNCCEPPTMFPAPSQSFCYSDTVIFPLTSSLDPDVQYTWTVSPNSVGATPCLSNCPDTIIQSLTNNTFGAQSVTYTVTPVASSTGCVGAPVDYQVTVFSQPEINSLVALPVCPNSCTNINTVVTGGQGPMNYMWTPGGFGANPEVCPLETTTYFLTITDSNSCTDTDSITVEIYDNPVVEITTDPDQTEICENDPEYPIEITATVTNGGSGAFLYDWGQYGSGLGTIEAEVSAEYSEGWSWTS